MIPISIGDKFRLIGPYQAIELTIDSITNNDIGEAIAFTGTAPMLPPKNMPCILRDGIWQSVPDGFPVSFIP
jgi:hypothetical protein